MSPDLHQLFDDAGRTPPPRRWDADDVVRRGHARRRRRQAATVTASVAATALVLAGVALLASPATQRGEPPAATSGPPTATGTPTATVTGIPTTAAPTPSSSSATPTVTACRASDIRLALGTGGIAAGTSYRSVVASARTGASCTLDGYPTVTLADAAGSVVGAPAQRDQVATAHRVVVGPGRASFLLGFADTANFPPAACAAVTVATLRVALPGDPTEIPLHLPAGTLTCSRDVSALGAPLVAGPWVRGSTGQ